MQLDPCILNLRFQGPLDSFDSTLDQKAQLFFLILALFDFFNENANQTSSTFTFGICIVCLTISVGSFSFWLLPNDEGMRELWQGSVEAEPEGLTQPPPQFWEALPPRRGRHTSTIVQRLGRHPQVREAVHQLCRGIDLLRHGDAELRFNFCCRITKSECASNKTGSKFTTKSQIFNFLCHCFCISSLSVLGFR